MVMEVIKNSVNRVVWTRNGGGDIISNKENVDKVKNLLNETGCGFCLAKFTQVTMHLGTGLVHSCHHPKAHSIPLTELENNPAALFNTSKLKEARKQMLSGEKPSECDYCWRVEDNDGPSDRYFKSLENWALSEHDTILKNGHEIDYYPTYLEVDFSNVCNFNCIYCGPEYSSVWVEDLKRNGPVKVLENTKKVQWIQGWQDLDSIAYKNREHNPYLDAFWKWFPEAYKRLKFYRITGGEPLLSKETFRSIDWLIQNPNPELDFSINSNMGVPDKLWYSFLDKIKVLANGNYVKKFTLFTSVDAWGEKAEYLRPGLDFELFKKRYEEVLNIGGVRCVIMCTFNLLSITSIQQLLEWQSELRSKYNIDRELLHLEKQFDVNIGGELSHTEREKMSGNHFSLVGIDIPYLRHPQCLDAQLSDKNLIEQYLLPAINSMAKNSGNTLWGIHQGFEPYEIEKMKRIVFDVMHFNSTHDDNNSVVVEGRAKFYDFINEMDKRHKKNFLDVFPEFISFYEKCKQAKDIILEEEARHLK
jgi:organic radical activating enzyme